MTERAGDGCNPGRALAYISIHSPGGVQGFQVPQNAMACCCWCMLYNETDFSEVKSLLETTCQARGFQVLYLPKFHHELNFIEQCWGSSKRIHRQCPISSKEATWSATFLWC